MKSNRKSPQGFTLVELVVVLMVLIGLAGILLPQFSGMLIRTHASTALTNLTEVNKAINFYQYKTLKGYPDKLDSLLNVGHTASTLLDPAVSPAVTPLQLDATQLASLNGSGITTVYNLYDTSTLPAGQSATFSGNNTGAPITLDTTAKEVANLSDTVAQANLGVGLQGAAGGETYVIFGLNDSSTAIPTCMENAPVHFDQVDPNAVYERVLLVFAIPVTGTASAAGWNARYVGSLCPNLAGATDHFNDYYSKNAQ
jgi:prepilin-type N-terminal cleavage/methylation domain-containing protein